MVIPGLLVPDLAQHSNRTDGLVFAPEGGSGLVPVNDAKVRERAYTAWDAAGVERIDLRDLTGSGTCCQASWRRPRRS